MSKFKAFTPWHRYVYSPNFFLYISYGTGKENLVKNQEPFNFAILSLILMRLMFDTAVLLKWEIRCYKAENLIGGQK